MVHPVGTSGWKSPTAPPQGDEPSDPTLLERAGTAAAAVGTVGTASPRRRGALQAALLVLVTAFLAGFLITQWGRLPDFDWRLHLGWLALSAVAIAAFYVIQGELWRWILRELGEDMDATQARAVWGKSVLARYVPTSALMVVGRVVMAERYGVSKRVCLASIAYELGIAVATAVMVGAYFAMQLPLLEDHAARYAILLLIPSALAGLHPRVFGPAANFGLRKLGREPLPRTMPFGWVLTFSAGYLVVWAAIGIGLFAFASALHPVEASELPYVAASYSVAFCVAVLTFVVPGGLGTREAALATALNVVLPGAVATAIAVAFRIVQTAIELLYVGVVTLLARRAARKSA